MELVNLIKNINMKWVVWVFKGRILGQKMNGYSFDGGTLRNQNGIVSIC